MLEHLLPCCFIHGSVSWFRNIGETSSTGTAQSGACVSWPGRECCRCLAGSTSCSAQNLRLMVRALTNFLWKLMQSRSGLQESLQSSHAEDVHAPNSWLPAGDITTTSGQLPLLSNVFGLRARSLRALRGAQRRLAC